MGRSFGAAGRLLFATAAIAAAATMVGCGGGSNGSNASGGSPATSSGGPSGPLLRPIRVLGPSPSYDPNENEAVKLVIDGMKQLGMQVQFNPVPDFPALDEAVKQNKYDIAASGYIGTEDRLEPTSLLAVPLSCATVKAGNYSNYCSKKYDKLLKVAETSTDQARRKQVVDQMQELLAKDLPMLVLYHPQVPVMYNTDQVSNAVYSPGAVYFHSKNILQAVPANGTLTVGDSNTGTTMNPMCTKDASDFESSFRNLNFDTLTRLDENGQVMNWMASDIAYPNARTIVVTLRDDLNFFDGSPVTADDVAFSYNFTKQWKVGQFAGPLSNVKSVRAVGPNKVRFDLKGGAGPIGAVLFSHLGILPKKVWDGVTEREGVKTPCDWKDFSLMGSGPYKIVSDDPNEALQLVRNDDYWSPGKAQKVVLHYYSSSQAQYLDMVSGNLDFTESDPGFTPTQVDQAQSKSFLSIQYKPSITDRYMAFNMLDGLPFHDFALRKAVAQVVDYDTIVSGILHGKADAGAGIIAPANTTWHDDAVKFPQFDLDAAKQTLTKAGYTWDDSGRLHAPANGSPQEFPPEGSGS